MRALVFPVTLLFAAILMSACGDDKPARSFSNGSEALKAAQDAVAHAGGYRIRVQQTNFVLARWGGSDGGTVEVSSDGTEAIARLKRTGENNADYEIRLTDGETYFKRSTCDQAFHISGGGAVLQPYLLMQTNALASAQDARLEDGRIRATLANLGEVFIDLDGKARPKMISSVLSTRQLVWTFDSWGNDIDVKKPAGVAGDGGPGGNPC